MSVIIQTENLHHRYMDEEEDSLKGVDLAIEKGSFVAILGHNGSGKSTLAKHFNGILTPTEGKVWINGMDTSDEDKLCAIEVIARQGMSVTRAETYIDALFLDRRDRPERVNVRAFLNHLTQSLARIQSAGISAISERRETDTHIVLTITIPK